MKVRNGFVSNSSSSSFIVALPSKPKTAIELCNILFSDLGYFSHPYDDVQYSTQTVAEAVFEELSESKPASVEEIVDTIDSGWFEGRPEFPMDSCRDKDKFEAYKKNCREKATEIARQFMGGKEGLEFFILEFSDNTQLGCALEHGDAFGGVPHLRISRH